MIKNILYFSRVGILTLTLAACMTDTKAPLKNEVSLKEDRSYLNDLRKDVSEEQRANNDFMALVLKDMGEVKYSPQDVRDRYYEKVRRTREKFNQQQTRAREKFNKEAQKQRDEYTKAAKKERDVFVAKKHKSEESSEFFQEQNNKRQAFYQDQNDARKDFEANMEQIRKDFNEDMSLKQKQFDDAYREYSKNYQEKQKEKKQIEETRAKVREEQRANPQAVPATAMAPGAEAYPGQAKDLEDFNKAKGRASQPLGTDDGQ